MLSNKIHFIMVMNYSNQAVSFEMGKTLRLRSSWSVGTQGISKTFTSFFEVQGLSSTPPGKGSTVIDIPFESVVEDLRKNFYEKLALIQSDSFRWKRLVLQPDATTTHLFSAILNPIGGKLTGGIPSDMEFIVNVLIDQRSQSRNLVLPGVSSSITDTGNLHDGALEATEKVFVEGFEVGGKLRLAYQRVAPNDSPRLVRGASCVGFRQRKSK